MRDFRAELASAENELLIMTAELKRLNRALQFATFSCATAGIMVATYVVLRSAGQCLP